MGAPGSYYWTGTVKVLNLTDNTYYKLNDDAMIGRRYTYLGKQLSGDQCENGSVEQQISGLWCCKVDTESTFQLKSKLAGSRPPTFLPLPCDGQIICQWLGFICLHQTLKWVQNTVTECMYVADTNLF